MRSLWFRSVQIICQCIWTVCHMGSSVDNTGLYVLHRKSLKEQSDLKEKPAVLIHPFPVHHPSFLFLLCLWLVILVHASPDESGIRNEEKFLEVSCLKSHLISSIESSWTAHPFLTSPAEISQKELLCWRNRKKPYCREQSYCFYLSNKKGSTAILN